MRHWEVVIIPAIAFVVWLLTAIFKGNETAKKPPPRRRPEQLDAMPPQRSHDGREMRPAVTAKRREQQVKRPKPPRTQQQQPIVLEEVREPMPQTALQSSRADYAPTQSPSKKPQADKTLPLAARSGTPQTALQSSRAGYAPTQSPSQSLTEPASVKTRATQNPLEQVRQLLRSPQSAATAFVLREILDSPRCRQRKR